MKKILSIVLTLMMVVSVLPMGTVGLTASAATSGYYTYTVSDSEATITYVDAAISGKVTIPSKLGGYKVTSIGEAAFAECYDITGVTIPNSVKSIGALAFYDCEGLKTITIPNSVTYIGEGAFLYCIELNNVTIPSSIESIETLTFAFCESLTSVTIPDSVTSIGVFAFAICGLTKIKIPDSVTNIEEGAFASCGMLSSLTVHSDNSVYHSSNNCIIHTEDKRLVVGCNSSVIPDDNSVTSIGDYAFCGCVEITSITIPNNITSIGEGAFAGCIGLTSITIPDNVTSIGDYAFSECTALTGITIPNGVTSIGEGVFEYCESFTSITIPDGVTSIGEGAFLECTGLTNVTIGTGVTNIGFGAFEGCSSIQKMTLPFIGEKLNGTSNTFFGYIFGAENSYNSAYSVPSSLKEVVVTTATVLGDSAFNNCKYITDVTIPKSVKKIDYGAFLECPDLTDIWYTGSESDREQISVFSYNDELKAATWHYNTCEKEHTYAGCPDATCEKCEWERSNVSDHTFDNDCDPICNKCDYERENGHEYTDVCDPSCEKCGEVRGIEHDFGDDDICDKCGRPMYLPGDVDADGEITDWDGVILARYLAGWDVEISALEALDIDGDGEITDWDGVMLDRYLAGWNIQIG